MAHVRAGRRRADRSRAGRPDPRAGDQDAAPRVPAHRAAGRARAAVRRRHRPAGRVRAEAVSPGRQGAGRPGRRAADAVGRDRHRAWLAGGAGPGREAEPLSGRDRAVDRGRRGAAGRARPGGRHRRGNRQGRPSPGNRGSDHRRPPGDLGGRRHDEPARLAGSRRGGHAERAVRRAPDPAPGRGRACGQAVPLSRSGLGRLYRPRQRRRVGRTGAPQRLRRVGRLAADPPRLPDRHPEPARGDRHLVAGLRARPAARAGLPGARHRHAAPGLPQPGAGRGSQAAPATDGAAATEAAAAAQDHAVGQEAVTGQTPRRDRRRLGPPKSGGWWPARAGHQPQVVTCPGRRGGCGRSRPSPTRSGSPTG